MITFTQTGTVLECDNSCIGNAYSDVTVAVNLSDDTFKDFDYVGLYVCDPISRKTYRSAVLAGKALIDHTALEHAGDVYIALVGYDSTTQLTTNSVQLVLRRSANPEDAYDPDADWKLQISDKLIREATEAAVKAYVAEHGLQIEVDDKPTKGSTKPVSSGGVYDALLNVGLEETGAQYARLGSIMVCSGTFQLSDFPILTSEGSNYRGAAIIAGKDAQFAAEGGFPACFTDTPRVAVFPTGSTSVVWTGTSRADAAGLTQVTFFRGASSTLSQLSGGYIAVGRIDGVRKGGAAVITEALKYLGQAVGDEIIDAYNEIRPDNTQSHGAGWCSELASVCAARAGIPADIFPRFASAYKGSKAFSDIGCFYKYNGTSFVKANVTGASSSEFSYTLGSETYTPQLGDVIWTSDDDGLAPKHTGLIVSVHPDSETGMTSIYTIEGNLSGDDSSSDDEDSTASGRVVKRMCRVAGSTANTRDRHIFAVGRVEYPADYSYGNNSGASGDDSSSSGGESGGGSGGSTVTPDPYEDGVVIAVDGLTATFNEDVITVGGATAALDTNGILVISGGSGSGSESGGGETTMYTVTKNLTNCQISNDASSVAAGTAYSATITANEGYTLSDVTCTMGGVQQAVTNGTISISNVTGDIVIAATATAQSVSTITVPDGFPVWHVWSDGLAQAVVYWTGGDGVATVSWYADNELVDQQTTSGETIDGYYYSAFNFNQNQKNYSTVYCIIESDETGETITCPAITPTYLD
ncbi:MAG: hypothetical protein ACI4PM_02920 [Butyricicoccus sp.]